MTVKKTYLHIFCILLLSIVTACKYIDSSDNPAGVPHGSDDSPRVPHNSNDNSLLNAQYVEYFEESKLITINTLNDMFLRSIILSNGENCGKAIFYVEQINIFEKELNASIKLLQNFIVNHYDQVTDVFLDGMIKNEIKERGKIYKEKFVYCYGNYSEYSAEVYNNIDEIVNKYYEEGFRFFWKNKNPLDREIIVSHRGGAAIFPTSPRFE